MTQTERTEAVIVVANKYGTPPEALECIESHARDLARKLDAVPTHEEAKAKLDALYSQRIHGSIVMERWEEWIMERLPNAAIVESEP